MSLGIISAKKLEKIFPIYAVEPDGLIVSKNADVSIAFRLVLPELFSLSEDALEQLHLDWVKALSVLPTGTTIHKQDWYYDARYEMQIDTSKQMNMSDRASERHFSGRPILRHESYLFVTLTVDPRNRVTSIGSTINRLKIVPKEINHQSAERFSSLVSQMERIIQDTDHIDIVRLTNDELTGTRSKAGIFERYLSLNPQGQPLLRDVDLQNGLRIGDKTCKLFTISNADSLPNQLSPGASVGGYSSDKARLYMSMGNTFGLYCNCPHIFNQYIYIEESKAVVAQLESRQRRMESLSGISRPNGVYAEEINSFLNETAAEQRRIVQAHYNILVFGDTDAELKDFAGIVSSCFSKIDVTPKEERYSLATAWWGGIPGNAGDLPKEEYFHTFLPQATCLFTLESNYRTSASPFGIRFVDRLSGYPVSLDLSDEPIQLGITTNRNKFILGPSGSGKSFITNHLLHNYYKQGSHIVIVDVGGSYSGTCDFVGGKYFEYTEANPISFNPFHIGETDVLDTEKKESLKTLLVTLWKSQSEELLRSEYVAISTAISQYYTYLETMDGAVPACFNTFYEFVDTHYTEHLKNEEVREQEFNVRNFLYSLRPFYGSGEFGYLLNSMDNRDLLKERFIVFELDNIKDHQILFPVVTLVIMDVFISKMRKVNGRKIICIEEAWKAIAKEGMADFIKYLFKTVRKFYGEAWVVTQEVEDILSSTVVKESIVANSDCKILMDQRKFANRFDDIARLLGLNEKDVAQVLSVNSALDPERKYKECFISFGGTSSNVYGVEVPIEEYLIYTTEKPEKQAVLKKVKELGSYELAIEALANEWRVA